MEKNNYNEKLDDFVQKSFDHYEENPSPNMWDRIEADLPAPSNKRPLILWWTQYRLQWTAAAVILLLGTTVLCVQYYYENKILAIQEAHQKSMNNNLKSDISQTPVKETLVPRVEQLATNASADSTTYLLYPTTRIAQPEHQISVGKQGIKLATESTKTQENKANIKAFPDVVVSTLNAHATNGGSAPQEQPNKEQAILPDKMKASMAHLSDLPILPTNPISSALVLKSQLPNTTYVFPKNLESKAVASNDAPKSVKNHLNWYVSLSGTPRLLVQQNRSQEPQATPNQRPKYRAKQDSPDLSSDIWLRVGVQGQSRLGLETGIGFQNIKRKSSHNARFAYRDGTYLPTPGSRSKQFDYDLNTYGGEASITLRTEENGTQSPTDNEPVRATIVSKEQLQILHIPLTLVARFGQKKAQLVLKAGLQGSWFLKNEVSVSTYKLEANNIRPLANRGITLNFDKPSLFNLGYSISAGLEYRWTPHWSLYASPVLSGNFSQKSNSGYKKQSNFVAGLNLGGQYWF